MNISSTYYNDKEIQYMKESMKKSISEFMSYTESEDYMGIILRAQIYIENDLNELIKKLLIHPEKISLQFFSAKLDAAYALGAIDDEWYGALKKFNRLRNKYAHDFGYELKTSDYEDLISTLSKDAKKEFQINLEREKWFIAFTNKIDADPQNLDLKYKLRILLSDFMLYIRQQNLDFETL